MKIDDDLLWRWDVYFEYFEILRRYGLTFEQFVEKNLNGTWEVK